MVTRLACLAFLLAAQVGRVLAQEELDYGPDLTAEELLDSWLGDDVLADMALEPAGFAGEFDLSVHAGVGYKENVLYSAVFPVDSAFSPSNPG